GDHLQRGGLAAARRSQQRDELALLDAEAEIVDGQLRAESLAEPVQNQKAHGPSAVFGGSQRSTSRFQRLVHSSRWALMASQSGCITSLARSPTGAMPSCGMVTSTFVLTGPLPSSLASTVCTGSDTRSLMNSWASGWAVALATGQ